MTLDAGDSYAGDPGTTTLPSDGTGKQGDLVDISGGQVSQMEAGATTTIFGVLTEDAPPAGEEVAVWTYGKVTANGDAGVGVGEAGVSGSNAGQVASGDSGNFIIEAEGGNRLPNGVVALEMR